MTRLLFWSTVIGLWFGIFINSYWLWKLMDAIGILAESVARLHGL